MYHSRHRWIFTAAAVFLLLFTAGDLAYPAMCGEDGDDSMFAATPTTTLSVAPAADSAPVHVDDCFCCCGHVIAGVVFHVANPFTVETTRFALTAHRVVVAPPAAFHPPRNA